MSESSGITWSSYESIRSEAEYNTRHKAAADIKAIIDRCIDRGMNTHFISGLELAHATVLGLTENKALDSDTLF